MIGRRGGERPARAEERRQPKRVARGKRGDSHRSEAIEGGEFLEGGYRAAGQRQRGQAIGGYGKQERQQGEEGARGGILQEVGCRGD